MTGKTSDAIRAEAREIVRQRLRRDGYVHMADETPDEQLDRTMAVAWARLGVAVRQLGVEIAAQRRRFAERVNRRSGDDE